MMKCASNDRTLYPFKKNDQSITYHHIIRKILMNNHDNDHI